MKNIKYATFVIVAIVLFGLASGILLDGLLKHIAKKDAYDPRKTLVCFKSPISPSIKQNEPIAIVNGKEITKADYDKWIALRTRVFCIVNGLDPTKRSAKVFSYNSKTKEIALADLVRRELIRQECMKTKVKLQSKDVKHAQKKFMEMVKKPEAKFEDFCRMLPPDEAAELRKQTEEDARGEAYLLLWAADSQLQVTDDEVNECIEKLKKHQEEIDLKNKEAFAKAAEAKAKILAGEKFGDVVEQLADPEFKSQGKAWDTIELDELEIEDPLFKFLSKASAGDISDPMDMEDGIGIVGVLRIDKPEDEDEDDLDQYVLVRCMFNAYEDVSEPMEPKALKKLMLDKKKTAAREAMMKEILKNADIKYPFGKKLFEKQKAKQNAKFR